MLVVEEERVHDAVDSRRQIVDQGEAALYLLFIQLYFQHQCLKPLGYCAPYSIETESFGPEQ